MEDELGDEMQARLNAESALVSAQRHLETLGGEVAELRARTEQQRQSVAPVGEQALEDQLEVAEEVRLRLADDLAKLTDELVHVKLVRAQEQEVRFTLESKLRKTADKSRQLDKQRLELALRSTNLEVQLAELKFCEAESQEKIACAFKEVIRSRIPHM